MRCVHCHAHMSQPNKIVLCHCIKIWKQTSMDTLTSKPSDSPQLDEVCTRARGEKTKTQNCHAHAYVNGYIIHMHIRMQAYARRISAHKCPCTQSDTYVRGHAKIFADTQIHTRQGDWQK